jgi:hypothetical protein
VNFRTKFIKAICSCLLPKLGFSAYKNNTDCESKNVFNSLVRGESCKLLAGLLKTSLATNCNKWTTIAMRMAEADMATRILCYRFWYPSYCRKKISPVKGRKWLIWKKNTKAKEIDWIPHFFNRAENSCLVWYYIFKCWHRTLRSSGLLSCFIYGRSPVQISARRPAILTEASVSSFSSSRQIPKWLSPKMTPRQLLPDPSQSFRLSYRPSP